MVNNLIVNLLSKFCLLSKIPLPCVINEKYPYLKMNNITLDAIETKINDKYMPVLHFISSFEGTSDKKLQNTATAKIH